MIWKLIARRGPARYTTASLSSKEFKNLKFEHNWENLVKMYDLRMWYMQNGPNDRQALTYTHELERLHNELNYLSFRDAGLRLLVFIGLFYGFYAIYEFPSFDWNDLHDPRHDSNMMAELESGGEEGGED